MDELFFRLILRRKQDNFCYLCGGNLSYIKKCATEQVGPQLDKFISDIAAEILMNVVQKKNITQSMIWDAEFEDGLRANLILYNN